MSRASRNRLKYTLGALCLALAAFPGFADGLPNRFTLGFSRVTSREERKETVVATAYYRASPRLFILTVTGPARQVVRFEAEYTLVYYPDEGKALKIAHGKSAANGMETELLSLFSKDKGLTRAGYRLNRLEPGPETVESLWIPPKSLAKSIKSARAVSDDRERIVSLTTTAASGKMLQRTEYSGYRDETPSLPAEILSRTYRDDGTLDQETRLSILSVAVDREIPAEISAFELPPGTPVEALQW